MENLAPPPTDPLVRKEPPFEWGRTSDLMPRRVETAIPDELDPDIAMWGNGGVMIWPFTGAPSTGGWQRGQVGVDNTGTVYVCTVSGEPGTWVAVGSGGGLTAWGEASTAKFAGSGSPVGVVTPTGEGDLYVDDTTPGLWQATGATSADWQKVGAGGGGAGAATVRKFPFAFDTPGILTGASLYTPTVGDILLDAWIEIDTAWDGTTPFGDIGQFIDNNFGFYGNFLVPINMAVASTENIGTGTVQLVPSLVQASATTAVAQTLETNGAPLSTDRQSLSPASTTFGAGNDSVPAKFTTTDPVKICVSQDGTNTGADPGSSQGSASLYLVTATPV